MTIDNQENLSSPVSNLKSQISNPPSSCTGSRRQFLWEMGAGFTGLALTGMLDQDGSFAKHAYAAESNLNPLAPRLPHFAAKAKHVIFLFMYGGPSSMD